MNRAMAFVAATIAASVAIPAAANGASAPAISFKLSRSGPTDRAQLGIDARFGPRSISTWTNEYPISALQGLTIAQLRSPTPTPVRFALIREAGRVDCAGRMQARGGDGSCTFAPDAGFADFLASRGIARPGLRDSYTLTMGSAGRAQVDALAAAKYPRPTLDQLVAMAIHRVDAAYISGLARAGFSQGTAGDLVDFKIHRVSPELVAAFRQAGFRNLGPSQLTALAIHQVTPQFIRGFAALGYHGLTAEQLTEMAIHRVTPEFARSFAAHGHGIIPVEKLIEMRIHNVTADDVAAVRRTGVVRRSADEPSRLGRAGPSGSRRQR